MGLSADFSFYLVAICNAGSLIGRISSGLMSDKLGCLNVLIPFSFASVVTTLIWPFCETKSSLIAIAVVYGYVCSSHSTLSKFAQGLFVELRRVHP